MRLASTIGSIALGLGTAASAETVAYSYDALGRLTSSVTSGGPNGGVSTGIAFDPAGNRSGYMVTGGTATLNSRPSAWDARTANIDIARAAGHLAGAAD